jgi:hypothetical protein
MALAQVFSEVFFYGKLAAEMPKHKGQACSISYLALLREVR